MEAYRKIIRTDDDTLAELYIQLATQAILDYKNRIEPLDTMKPLIAELANFYVFEEKRKGISSRSEGAISETYEDLSTTGGVPAFIKNRLDRYVILHVAKHKGE